MTPIIEEQEGEGLGAEGVEECIQTDADGEWTNAADSATPEGEEIEGSDFSEPSQPLPGKRV